jgi:hypothetical protein
MREAARVFLVAYGVVVIAYAVWRSRGQASPDPLRESGPVL